MARQEKSEDIAILITISGGLIEQAVFDENYQTFCILIKL